MLGCRTVCPKCEHQFECCSTKAPCCTTEARRSLNALSGGGLIASMAPQFSDSYLPQISPSAPLSFVLPSMVVQQLQYQLKEAKPEAEVQSLSENLRSLRQCGWFYENITYQQSDDLLRDKSVGTFLVRESSDPSFLYSLSVQTERGPTSVRIHFINGFFRLDAQPHLQAVMPLFRSVILLVQHYVKQCRKNDAQVWVDPNGKLYSPILLDRPLYKDVDPHSLKHLARLALNKAMSNPESKRDSKTMPATTSLKSLHENLGIPQSLSIYLSRYTYWL